MESHGLRCLHKDRDNWLLADEGTSSSSCNEQMDVEDSILEIYENFQEHLLLSTEDINPHSTSDLQLKRQYTAKYLLHGLKTLAPSYCCLDASRPWLCYWILHAAELLNIEIPESQKLHIIEFLGRCQCDSGGFGGGPQQSAHLAPTYAAVSALCILRREEAYKVINRETLYKFYMRMHQSDGSFIMHDGGEVDIRGCYLSAAVARLTNIVTDQLFHNTLQWISSCQTYEGGFGGTPGMEAHGGYAYCGVAAYNLISQSFSHTQAGGDASRKVQVLFDVDRLLYWTVQRQMSFEGGFQGRTNKLVDSCYSFWQSAIIPAIFCSSNYQGPPAHSEIVDNGALQEYILLCCQYAKGGLIDKPGRSRDYYHTCYALSGLSISQNFTYTEKLHVVGKPNNLLSVTHPYFNLTNEAVEETLTYFNKLNLITVS